MAYHAMKSNHDLTGPILAQACLEPLGDSAIVTKLRCYNNAVVRCINRRCGSR